MKNTLSKTLLLLVVGGVALAVCFFGYKAKSDSVRKQKIEYAQETAKKESANIKAIKTRVEKFYVNSSHDTLLNNVTKENVKKEYDKLGSIKISAQDFGVPENALTSDVKELGKEKEETQKLINDVQDKLNMQTSISDLFEGGVKDWQAEAPAEVTNNLAIKDNVKKDSLTSLKDEISTKDGLWNKIANKYLSIAQTQVAQAEDVEKLISKMIKDGKITKDATTENYSLLLSKIGNIKNTKLKNKYSEQAANIYSQMVSNVEATPVESKEPAEPVVTQPTEAPVVQESAVEQNQAVQQNNTVPNGQPVETPNQGTQTGNVNQSNTNQPNTNPGNNATDQNAVAPTTPANPVVPNQGNASNGSGTN
ncbi:hypothetical protein [Floricoccus penangensis]|uniref:hypothetical protein n=1 Tax=Floricoccus penangensis TaxID=1859475 RepID=UPI00203AA400|nr:hypothetical protein [Floricoccus penangensis]URZ87618.1 hypothetical protein KIW23_00795 [Floricoccus penangensis]